MSYKYPIETAKIILSFIQNVIGSKDPITINSGIYRHLIDNEGFDENMDTIVIKPGDEGIINFEDIDEALDKMYTM